MVENRIPEKIVSAPPPSISSTLERAIHQYLETPLSPFDSLQQAADPLSAEMRAAFDFLKLFALPEQQVTPDVLQGICRQVAGICKENNYILPSVLASKLLEVNNQDNPIENQKIIEALKLLEIPDSLGCLPKPLSPLIIGLVNVVNAGTEDGNKLEVTGWDIKNLKGINTGIRRLFQQFGDTIKDFFQGTYRTCADLIVRSILKGKGVFFRIGGDEVGVINRPKYFGQNEVLETANERIDHINEDLGLGDIPHTNAEKSSGIGVLIAETQDKDLITENSIKASLDTVKAKDRAKVNTNSVPRKTRRITTAEAVQKIKIPALFTYLRGIFGRPFPQNHSAQTLERIENITNKQPESIQDLQNLGSNTSDTSEVYQASIEYVGDNILSNDPVTELYGHEAMALIEAVQQNSAEFILSLTNLAGLNDALGMEGADTFLKSTADLIQEKTKAHDLCKHFTLGHTGGGRFLLNYDQNTPAENLKQFQTNILEASENLAKEMVGVPDSRTRYSEKHPEVRFHVNGVRLLLIIPEDEEAQEPNLFDEIGTAIHWLDENPSNPVPENVQAIILANQVSVPLPSP